MSKQLPEDSGYSDNGDNLRAVGLLMNKSLEVDKVEGEPIFKKERYKGQNVSCILDFGTNYFKKKPRSTSGDKQAKEVM